jgi:hypothetical protein
MTAAEPPSERVEPADPDGSPPALADAPSAVADSPAEQPASAEQYALFLHYRAQGRARRERRRRQLRIAVGTLVAGAWLLTAVLFWTRHQRPPIATRIIEPPATPAWQSTETAAARPDDPAPPKGRTALSSEVPVGSTPSASAVSPPVSSRAPEPPRSVPSPVAPTSPAPAASTPSPSTESPAPPATAIKPAPPVASPAPPPVASTPTPPAVSANPSIAPPPPATPAVRVTDVSYQPRERLASVHAGDPKDTIFELFGTAFERRNGSLVRIEGMRLRASGRSAQHAQVEVAEVRINDTMAAGNLYWFLFGDGRLIAWGRAEDWPVATARYQVEIEYQPDPTPGRRSVNRS